MTTPEYELLANRTSSIPIEGANLSVVSQSSASPEAKRLYATFRETFGRPQIPAGWSDLQITEAIHLTALFAGFNRVVNAFGLPSQELLKMFAEGPQ